MKQKKLQDVNTDKTLASKKKLCYALGGIVDNRKRYVSCMLSQPVSQSWMKILEPDRNRSFPILLMGAMYSI